MQITKTVRLTGESSESIDAAITAVLDRAEATLRDIQSYVVVRVAGRHDATDGWVHEVVCDVTFGVKDATTHG